MGRSGQAGSHDLLKAVDKQPMSPLALTALQGKTDDYRSDVWATSPERGTYFKGRRTAAERAAIAATLAVFLTGSIVGITRTQGAAHAWLVGVAAILGTAALLAVIWASLPYVSARLAFRGRKKADAAYRVDIALTQLCDEDDLPLNELFEYNRRQLDAYQQLTRRQQSVAFFLTWGAATVGLAVLAVGIALSYRTRTGTASYVVGGLSGLGTLLSGYLGKTFFNGYKEAIKQLAFYYAEPSLTGRVLMAERAAQNLDDKHLGKYADAIVNKLVTWDPPADNETSTNKSDQNPGNGNPKTNTSTSNGDGAGSSGAAAQSGANSKKAS